MKYKVSITAIVDSTDAVTRDKIKDGIVALQSKLQRINAFETSRIVVEECYHDLNPSLSCVKLYQWEKV